jgi:hypothetical protein
MQEGFAPLFPCIDSISLRPSQIGSAITEAHHHSLGFPYSNNSVRLPKVRGQKLDFRVRIVKSHSFVVLQSRMFIRSFITP